MFRRERQKDSVNPELQQKIREYESFQKQVKSFYEKSEKVEKLDDTILAEFKELLKTKPTFYKDDKVHQIALNLARLQPSFSLKECFRDSINSFHNTDDKDGDSLWLAMTVN